MHKKISDEHTKKSNKTKKKNQNPQKSDDQYNLSQDDNEANTNRYVDGSQMLDQNLDDLTLNKIRMRNKNKIIFGQLNVNSIRNKFVFLSEIINKNADIFLVSETKLDESFPTMQFKIPNYSLPYRLDRDRHGGGLMLYVREGIPSKLIKKEQGYEGLFVEIKIKKQNWLLCCSYNPHVQNINAHLDQLQQSLDSLLGKYERFLLLGDLNCEIDKFNMPDFCNSMNLSALIKIPTCYKNPNNPTCIDHMLTNLPGSFKSSYTIENSLSDFHKITLAILQTDFKKSDPKFIRYRCYSNFDENMFERKISRIVTLNSLEFTEKMEEVMKVLNEQAPIKTKVVRGNNSPFMTKTLRKAIMYRSRLRNIYIKNRSALNEYNYKKQRNHCLALLRTTKRNYFESLDENRITDSKKFWKTVKPFFTNKGLAQEKIILVEEENIVKKDKELSETFNEYFGNIIKNLNLPIPPFDSSSSEENPVKNSILKYKNHQSIIEIKKNRNANPKFCFKPTTKEEIKKIIMNLSSHKAQANSDIPLKIVKQFSEVFSKFFSKSINDSFNTSQFPNILKSATITPIHKRNSKNDKSNYRPISILPLTSKIFERIYHNQLTEYFKDIFNDHQCGFRKCFSTQITLLSLEELWKKCIDIKELFGALMIDLSKAFDCMSHELLIAKMEAYGLDTPSLNLIADYLTHRKQRTKVGNEFSNWHCIKDGVPQGSILGPLLFNVYLCDLFYQIEDTEVANYADDTTPFTSGSSWEEVKLKLNSVAERIFTWLSYNQMIGNPEKCQLITNMKNDALFITVHNKDVFNSQQAKILGVTFDNRLTFEPHIKGLCQTAGQKISALARISSYMSIPKRKKLMNAFFKCQFNYCPLIWMFHSRSLEQKINNIHERCLRIVYSDNVSSFQDLLEIDGAVSFHQRAIQLLAIELYKVKNNEAISTVKNIFNLSNKSVETRQKSFFRSRRVLSELHGKSSLSFLGPKIWDAIPEDLKASRNLKIFKKKIKHWKPSTCPCRNCRPYVKGIGFTN